MHTQAWNLHIIKTFNKLPIKVVLHPGNSFITPQAQQPRVDGLQHHNSSHELVANPPEPVLGNSEYFQPEGTTDRLPTSSIGHNHFGVSVGAIDQEVVQHPLILLTQITL